MRKSVRKISNISRFIIYIILLLIIAAVIGLSVFFTNGFTTGFKTFFVLHDNKINMNKVEGLLFYPNTAYDFKPRYTFSYINQDIPKDFTVKIIPNNNETFDFTVDGQVFSYGVIKDLTAGFEIQIYEDSFILLVPKNMQKVLEALYPDKSVIVPELPSDKDYFTLLIYSYNGESVIRFNFGIYIQVEGIELDNENMVI